VPFELFDRTKLSLLPLEKRKHDLDLSVMMYPDSTHSAKQHPNIDAVAELIVKARAKGAPVLMMMGAHVIRAGAAPLLIDLMEKGLITHFALNGAGAIHDFEFALIGQTTESVERYISEGQFGLWLETGRLNDAAMLAVEQNIGLGEAVGMMIETEGFKYKHISLFAAGYRCQVPVTAHVGIGCDIVHEHPNCDGAAIGQSSYTDFLIFANTINNLEGGVFLNFGSAVTGPEVYLKCLSMARNVAHQQGRRIANFATAVFDLMPFDGIDVRTAPPKDDARYYFRPWKTILSRTVADGGESYYVQGRHNETIPDLYRRIIEKV